MEEHIPNCTRAEVFLLLLCQVQLRKHGLRWSGLQRSTTVLDVGKPHERYRMRERSPCFRRGVFHCINSGISETPLRNVSGFYVNCLKLRTFNPPYSDGQKQSPDANCYLFLLLFFFQNTGRLSKREQVLTARGLPSTPSLSASGLTTNTTSTSQAARPTTAR